MKGMVLVLVGLVGGVAGGFLTRAVSDNSAATSGQRSARSNASDAELADLRRRVETLEYRAARPDPDRTVERTSDKAAPPQAESGMASPTRKPPKTEAESRAVKEMVAGLLGKEMTNDASSRFFMWLTRNKGKISASIRALEKAVKADPNNPELHVALATAYVAKLANDTPDGPQKGLIWAKASGSYDAAIKLKPDHWQARFGKAFGVSMAPEFLGLKPVAIKQFEELRKIQEQRAPEPHHAQTYFRLGSLYKNMGNIDKARDIWDQGIGRFPEDKTLKEALEASTKR